MIPDGQSAAALYRPPHSFSYLKYVAFITDDDICTWIQQALFDGGCGSLRRSESPEHRVADDHNAASVAPRLYNTTRKQRHVSVAAVIFEGFSCLC